MEFKSSNEALDWMIEHPLEKLYDQYGNYVATYIKESNTIESLWSPVYEDKYIDFCPEYIKYTPEEFVEVFDGVQIKTKE